MYWRLMLFVLFLYLFLTNIVKMLVCPTKNRVISLFMSQKLNTLRAALT